MICLFFFCFLFCFFSVFSWSFFRLFFVDGDTLFTHQNHSHSFTEYWPISQKANTYQYGNAHGGDLSRACSALILALALALETNDETIPSVFFGGFFLAFCPLLVIDVWIHSIMNSRNSEQKTKIQEPNSHKSKMKKKKKSKWLTASTSPLFLFLRHGNDGIFSYVVLLWDMTRKSSVYWWIFRNEKRGFTLITNKQLNHTPLFFVFVFFVMAKRTICYSHLLATQTYITHIMMVFRNEEWGLEETKILRNQIWKNTWVNNQGMLHAPFFCFSVMAEMTYFFRSLLFRETSRAHTMTNSEIEEWRFERGLHMQKQAQNETRTTNQNAKWQGEFE